MTFSVNGISLIDSTPKTQDFESLGNKPSGLVNDPANVWISACPEEH